MNSDWITTVAFATICSTILSTIANALIIPFISHRLAKDRARIDTKLRVVAEARLKVLDKQLTEVSAARVRLNEAFSEVHKLLSDLWRRGPEANYGELIESVEVRIRSAMLAGGLLPPVLRKQSLIVARKLQDELQETINWVNEPEEARTQAVTLAQGRLEEVATSMALVFDRWIHTEHETFEQNLEKVFEKRPLFSSPPPT